MLLSPGLDDCSYKQLHSKVGFSKVYAQELADFAKEQKVIHTSLAGQGSIRALCVLLATRACACACACMRVCARARVCVCVCVCAMHACLPPYPPSFR